MIGSWMWRTIAVITLWLPTIACGASERSASGGTVRDSAGITVIELPATTPTGYEIQVSDDPSFTLPPNLEFGQVADISVGDGIVAVLDGLEAAVTTFDSAGNLIARFGQEGGGPGEFNPRGLASVVVSHGDVWVPDVALERITRFAPDGTVLETVPLPFSDGHAVDWANATPDGQILRLRNPDGDLLVRSDATGADTLHRFPPSQDAPNTVLGALPLWTALPDGAIVIAWTDGFELSRLEPGSVKPTWTLRRAGPAREVTEADEEHITALLEESLMQRTGGEISTGLREQMMSSTRMPVRAPVLAGMWTGPEGTIWVERAKDITAMGTEALRVGEAAGLGSAVWEVFNQDGSFRGTAILPDRFQPQEFAGPLIYGVQLDELDVPTVVRLRVTLN